ncbi:MAG: M67 family metallopeptidase [Planctomycetes bacterium]|nr:M67 family metallopeptidase [Planctomycetota bacterium]
MRIEHENKGIAYLHLPPELRAELRLWAEAGYPAEACGLLIGRTMGARVEVLHVRKARNRDKEHAADRYDLDPSDFLRADTDARAAGLDVVGIWHSHPDHPPIPSETDRRGAWPEYSYLIITVDGGRATEMRAWRAREGGFQAEGIET